MNAHRILILLAAILVTTGQALIVATGTAPGAHSATPQAAGRVA